MWNHLRSYAAPALILFFVSLLVFGASMPRFAVYIAALCAVEWLCIIAYGKRANRPFFCRVLAMGVGNMLAFALQWRYMGKSVSLANIDVLEALLLLLLLAGAVWAAIIAFGADKAKTGQPAEAKNSTWQPLPEREHDLLRLESLLQSGEPIVGVDARWGDGKTFLIDRLCEQAFVTEHYEVVRVNVLSGHEDELESSLINEFDRILRRNRIFSQASKQMLKLLESNDVLKQLRWLLIEDSQSVSRTFSGVLSDLEKLEKDVLIVVDDVERLGSDTQIRKLFALMESVSSRKVRILYLFNSRQLTKFDRAYLEKYIPRYMSLTPAHFESIVRLLWDELRMDAAGVKREDVEHLVTVPQLDTNLANILALDSERASRVFRLDNITVRRVRDFLLEFRNLTVPEGSAAPAFPEADRELLLKCLFIKHFFYDDFKELTIGVSITDCALFRFNEEEREFLSRNYTLPIPSRSSLRELLNVRLKTLSSKGMQNFAEALLLHDGNLNRLLAISLLGYDYADIWRQAQEKERPGARPDGDGSRARNPHEQFIHRAEALGNEDVEDIKRERNNERIDRVMWNLLANGASELTDLDAYVRHFQDVVLGVAPEAQTEAWKQFASDAYYANIYKDNTTCDRLGVDSFLPLFQGFRVTGAGSEQWLKLLDFYFGRKAHDVISVEMVQNLNYVAITEHRVYLSVLRHFTQRRIEGNLNREPCMYIFLRQTLRMVSTLGYSSDDRFHSLWHPDRNGPQSEPKLPSDKWEKAVLELDGQFDDMKAALERGKLRESGLETLDADIDAIIDFIDKCHELIAAEKSIQMRTPRIEVGEVTTRSQHQDMVDKLRRDRESGRDEALWRESVRAAYERGELNFNEARGLVEG